MLENLIYDASRSSIGAKYKTYRSDGAKSMGFILFSTNISAPWAFQKSVLKQLRKQVTIIYS